MHKLKIWNHQCCSIPPFLTTSVDKPCGRNNCMIWLHHFHQLQHNMSSFFCPPREDESCGESCWRDQRGPVDSAEGRSYRRYQRLLGISVLIHHWAEIWIIHQHVCGFILSERPRAWRKPEFGCGEKKTQKSEAANGQGRMEKVIGSCEKLVKHPFCVIRFATCKGTALVYFSFLFLLKMKVEAGQLNYMKRVHVYCVGIGSIRETFLILPPEVLSKMVGASQKYFCFVFLKTRMLVLLLRCESSKITFQERFHR